MDLAFGLAVLVAVGLVARQRWQKRAAERAWERRPGHSPATAVTYESFDVIVSNPGGGADIGQAIGVVNIQDDDVPGTLAFTEGVVSVDETADSVTLKVSSSS